MSRYATAILAAGTILLVSLSGGAEVPDIDIEFETPKRPPAPPVPEPSVPAASEEPTAGTSAGRPAEAAETAETAGEDSQITGRQLIEQVGRRMISGRGEDEPVSEAAEKPDVPGQPVGPAPPGPDRSSEEKPAFQQDAPAGQGAPVLDTDDRPGSWQGPSALRVIGALILVAGAIGGGLYVLRRFYLRRMMPQGSSGPLQVVSRVFIEPGRSILLVRVGERLLVLASTREGLNRVGEITDKKEVEEVLRDAGQGARKGGFAEALEAGGINLTDEDSE